MSDKDKRIATLLAQHPAPPTGDGAALHDWAMKLAEDVEAAERERCAITPTTETGLKVCAHRPRLQLDCPGIRTDCCAVMGKSTGKRVRWIQATGRGSGYYGNCERCGKHMSMAYKLMSGDEYIRENGQLYNNAFAVSYGHKECIERDYAHELANAGGEQQ